MMLLVTLLSFISCIQIPLLSPITTLDTKPVAQSDIEFYKNIITFVQSSYCLDGLSNWTCTTCDSRYGTPKIRTVGDFHSNLFGYVGYFKERNQIVISFRGTRNLKNWVNDLKIAQPDCPFPNAPPGSSVHLGFLQSWEYIKPEVVDELLILVNLYPNSSLLITGHSLGGAIAALASADLITNYPDLNVKSWAVFTVGQPRIGNDIFSEWYFKLGLNFKRVVNQFDLIPHLPPRALNFYHVGLEVYIENDQGDTLYCPATVLIESKECANVHTIFSLYYHAFAWDIQISHKSCLFEP